MRILLIIAAALIVVPSATAAFSLTMTTGSPTTAPGVTLTGVDQTKTFTIVTSVVDTRTPPTAGWNETASATIPSVGANLLPALKVTTVAATGATTAPVNSITWPITLSTTAVKVFNAAVNTGKGTMAVTHTFQITYPSNVLPGTYSSVVTLALVSGP